MRRVWCPGRGIVYGWATRLHHLRSNGQAQPWISWPALSVRHGRDVRCYALYIVCKDVPVHRHDMARVSQRVDGARLGSNESYQVASHVLLGQDSTRSARPQVVKFKEAATAHRSPAVHAGWGGSKWSAVIGTGVAGAHTMIHLAPLLGIRHRLVGRGVGRGSGKGSIAVGVAVEAVVAVGVAVEAVVAVGVAVLMGRRGWHRIRAIGGRCQLFLCSFGHEQAGLSCNQGWSCRGARMRRELAGTAGSSPINVV